MYEFESVYTNNQDDLGNTNNNINSSEEVIIKNHAAKDDIAMNINNDVGNSDVTKQNNHDNYNSNKNSNNNSNNERNNDNNMNDNKSSKRNGNDNSNIINNKLGLNTRLLQTFLNFLNKACENNINQIEKVITLQQFL